jgi:enterochelin esterase-like enzyme
MHATASLAFVCQHKRRQRKSYSLNDAKVIKANKEFDAELTRLNIRHGYTVVPGTHSMFVWRPALSSFVQQIFRR